MKARVAVVVMSKLLFGAGSVVAALTAGRGLLPYAALGFVCLAFGLVIAVVMVLGFLGGYLAPVLIATGSANHIGLFSYYAVLNAAAPHAAHATRPRACRGSLPRAGRARFPRRSGRTGPRQ